MATAATIFSQADRQRIRDAVAQAEGKTAAEIIPVVADASGRYDRAEDVAGLWLGAAALVVAWTLIPAEDTVTGSWGGTQPWVRLAAMLGALIGGFLLGAALVGRMPRLRRLFTPRAQMGDETAARARAVFFDQRVHHTAGGSGLLIYLSLYERRAVLLGDAQVVEALGQGRLDQLCAELTARIGRGRPADALCETIAAAGDALAGPLPRRPDDVNELPDGLVILDEIR